MVAACVLETGVLILCLLSTFEFLTCRGAVCPRRVISSGRAAIAPCAGPERPCQHTLDESQPPFSYCYKPLSSLCLDTVATATTHDRFLFGIIISDCLYLIISSNACCFVRTRSSPAVLMPSPPSYHVINRGLL